MLTARVEFNLEQRRPLYQPSLRHLLTYTEGHTYSAYIYILPYRPISILCTYICNFFLSNIPQLKLCFLFAALIFKTIRICRTYVYIYTHSMYIHTYIQCLGDSYNANPTASLWASSLNYLGLRTYVCWIGTYICRYSAAVLVPTSIWLLFWGTFDSTPGKPVITQTNGKRPYLSYWVVTG